MIKVEGVAQMHRLKVKAVLKIILKGAYHLEAKQNKITHLVKIMPQGSWYAICLLELF